MQRALRIAERLHQRLEGRAVVVVAIDVTQQAEQARNHRLLGAGLEVLEAVAHARLELGKIPALARHPDHRDGEQLAPRQLVQRREDLAVAQVSGRTE